jgi:hypothetical protein
MRTAKQDQIADEVEKTLQSFDHDIVLEANPFLASRIKAERESRLHECRRGFALRIGLNQAIMLFVLLVNLITVAYWYGWNSKHALQEQVVSALTSDFQVDQSQDLF